MRSRGLAAALAAALALAAGCDEQSLELGEPRGGEGRLEARPAPAPEGPPLPRGLSRFGPGERGILYVPPGHERSRPAGLVLALHGAGGNGVNAVKRMIPFAQRSGSIALGVLSHAPTWDYVLGGYGPDLAFIDDALRRVFRSARIDPVRVGVAGFSDGATYSLSLGVTNGDLFRHVVAFSPGFADLENPHGSPRVFITHGTEDHTLPIDATSRELVPQLRELGLRVRFVEFRGGHEINDALVPRAMAWLERPG